MEKIKGKSKLPEYTQWKSMKSRCYSPSATKGKYKENNTIFIDRFGNKKHFK